SLARLGRLGFLYMGASFLPRDITTRLTTTFNWWLPDYGVNDGTRHPLAAGLNPVIHQFTSVKPSLDRNVIHDQARWQQLTDATTSTSTVEEETKLILVPRRAVPTMPIPTGRVAHIRFDRATKTLQSFGYDFVRTTGGWKFTDFGDLVLAELTLPT